MTLREIRKENHLTQAEVASMLSIPLRTYVRYENDSNYVDTYKYSKMLEDLKKSVAVDEEHGVLSLNTIQNIVVPVLNKHNIKYCMLFGSYAKNKARENSDIDLLIDTDITGLAFFKIIEELRQATHKKIDLLRLKDLEIGNPIILEILKEGIRII